MLAPALQVVAVVAVCLGGRGSSAEELAGLNATVSIVSLLGAAWHGMVPSCVMNTTPSSSCSFHFFSLLFLVFQHMCRY